jgi:hypothetical protein
VENIQSNPSILQFNLFFIPLFHVGYEIAKEKTKYKTMLHKDLFNPNFPESFNKVHLKKKIAHTSIKDDRYSRLMIKYALNGPHEGLHVNNHLS